MRHLWIVRFAIASAMTVIAAINLIRVPRELQAVAVGVVALVLLTWAEVDRRRSVRESPAFQRHVEDLQGYAAQLANFVSGTVDTIDMTRDLGPWFRGHFEKLARKVDERNSQVTEIMVGDAKAKTLIEIQRKALALTDQSGYGGLGLSIAKAWVDPQALVWRVQEDWIVVGTSDTSSVWQIAHPPTDGSTADDLIERLKAAVQTFSTDPAVMAHRKNYPKIPALSKSLAAELTMAVHIHQPPGHCAGCPK